MSDASLKIQFKNFGTLDRPWPPPLCFLAERKAAGCADSLAKKFATTSVDVVRNQPGNQGHFFGKSVSNEDDVFLFVSVWRDLNAVKTRFGTDWESSFLPPGYSDLIEECSVKHFALRTDWHSGE